MTQTLQGATDVPGYRLTLMFVTALSYSPANAEAAQLYRENLKEYHKRARHLCECCPTQLTKLSGSQHGRSELGRVVHRYDLVTFASKFGLIL